MDQIALKSYGQTINFFHSDIGKVKALTSKPAGAQNLQKSTYYKMCYSNLFSTSHSFYLVCLNGVKEPLSLTQTASLLTENRIEICVP